MSGVQVLDKYYISITLLITFGYQLSFFIIAFVLQFDKVTDISGGTNFILLASLTLGLSGARTNARHLVASLLLIVWAARLGGFLLFRILRTGVDHRFNEMRAHLTKFGTFWLLQMLWVWGVSLPVVVFNSPGITRWDGAAPAFGTARDIAGVVLWALGFVIESVADAQRFRWREREGSDGRPCTRWLHAVSRHPNYFGEIITQFGIFTIVSSVASYLPGSARSALYATILGPIWLTVLLMFISGIKLSEPTSAKKRYEKDLYWEEYSEWLNSTSILIPFPPQLYRRMPTILKRTIFLEFPMYVFDPKHTDVRRGQSADDEE